MNLEQLLEPNHGLTGWRLLWAKVLHFCGFLGLRVTAVEPMKDGTWLVMLRDRLGNPAILRGSSTVWHTLPSYRRASTSVEMLCSDALTKKKYQLSDQAHESRTA